MPLLASVMAENGIKRKNHRRGILTAPVTETDGNLWGSEFMIADTDGFKRAGHFKYIPFPQKVRQSESQWRVDSAT